jgi:glycine dehydrogenase subunit 2
MSTEVKLRKYHGHVWDEPLIDELSTPGHRGLLPPEAEPEIKAAVGSVDAILPEEMLRKTPADLPELSQPQVVRHFTRLSQMTLGCDVANDIGSGTCTMKHNPKIHEKLCGLPQMADVHPWQDESTLQGTLEMVYGCRDYINEISGMDEVSFHPCSGGQAVFAAACLMRAYHEANGTGEKDQVITTMFSHPVDAACPATVGYEVITIMPGKDGYPDFEAFKAALSDRTAGIFMTNPEDIGLYNPKIKEIVDLTHSMGGICFTDQANANGILGIARAGDAGFDMCHFNLHKTFSSPHGCVGPGCGALAVKEGLAKFLPAPVVTYDGKSYHLDYDRPDSLGVIRDFYGNLPVVLRAYAWIRTLGPDGLKEVAEISVLNYNYLEKLLMEIPGVSMSYGLGKLGEGRIRLDQARFSWEKMKEETGISTEAVAMRMTDFGLVNYWESHHPHVIPDPFTPEPAETYSKADCEYFAAVMRQISTEAYETPEIFENAPHNGSIPQVDLSPLEEYEKTILSCKEYRRRKKK